MIQSSPSANKPSQSIKLNKFLLSSKLIATGVKTFVTSSLIPVRPRSDGDPKQNGRRAFLPHIVIRPFGHKNSIFWKCVAGCPLGAPHHHKYYCVWTESVSALENANGSTKRPQNLHIRDTLDSPNTSKHTEIGVSSTSSTSKHNYRFMIQNKI